MSTAVVSIDSDIKRKKWVREGLLHSAPKSFFAPYMGTSKNSIVFIAKNENASEGHTVVFDFEGTPGGRAIKGKDTAFGKGESKRQFSSKITVDRYRLPVNNGDSFDGVDVGNLAITQHTNSRKHLADKYIVWRDQGLFDASQGLLGQNPSHIIEFTTGFDYNNLLEISNTLKTSRGFSTGTTRRPLEPFMLEDGRPIWLFVVDSDTATKLKTSAGYQNIVINADFRGNNNRAIKGVIGKIDNLLIVEAGTFFGKTYAAGTSLDLKDTEVEISGLRQFDTANNVWSGQDGYDVAATQMSRNLILGAGALQLAYGKMPDYKWQPSQDFGITSESALEVWLQIQKTNLKAEQTDYKKAKVSNIDWGVVAADITHA